LGLYTCGIKAQDTKCSTKYMRFLAFLVGGSMIKNFIKRILSTIDSQFKTSLYERAFKLEEAYYSSNFLNTIRCSIGPATVKWKYKLGIKDKNSLKLHLGCGDRHFEDYVNVDRRKTRVTDLVCDIRKLPYPDNSVELIETYHVIEHLPRHDLPKALETWHRILMPGGKLIIECPDFDEAVKEYMEGNEKRIDNIFGLQRFSGDAHLFGYNLKRLEKLLEAAVFKDIKQSEPQDNHTKDEPCLRVECVKGDEP
jgi:SAM-dependent methyltransferase